MKFAQEKHIEACSSLNMHRWTSATQCGCLLFPTANLAFGFCGLEGLVQLGAITGLQIAFIICCRAERCDVVGCRFVAVGSFGCMAW